MAIVLLAPQHQQCALTSCNTLLTSLKVPSAAVPLQRHQFMCAAVIRRLHFPDPPPSCPPPFPDALEPLVELLPATAASAFATALLMAVCTLCDTCAALACAVPPAKHRNGKLATAYWHMILAPGAALTA